MRLHIFTSLVEKDRTTQIRARRARIPTSLFVVNNLGIGGSERKIVRLANRLKEEGVNVSLACLNGPFTIEQGIRRDVPLRKLERTRQVLLRRAAGACARRSCASGPRR